MYVLKKKGDAMIKKQEVKPTGGSSEKVSQPKRVQTAEGWKRMMKKNKQEKGKPSIIKDL